MRDIEVIVPDSAEQARDPRRTEENVHTIALGAILGVIAGQVLHRHPEVNTLIGAISFCSGQWIVRKAHLAESEILSETAYQKLMGMNSFPHIDGDQTAIDQLDQYFVRLSRVGWLRNLGYLLVGFGIGIESKTHRKQIINVADNLVHR